MRRICAITERRADYSKLRPVLRKIAADPEFELLLVVAGHHLLPDLGNTLELVERDGFRIAARVPMFSAHGRDTGAEMARGMGKALIGITRALEKVKPDIMLVGFDLGAHLAAAMAAAHMNIPVAHIEGGEVSGSIDDCLRHAITRFANLHFTSTKIAAKRLIRMGENPAYVFVVGCPSLDVILSVEFIPATELEQMFNLDLSKPFVLCVQHPVTTEQDKAEEQVTETLKAIKKARMQSMLIYPNIDAGGRRIIKVIEKSGIPFYKNLPFEVFVSLMKVAAVIVGNSSAGIVEAASLKLPIVNIGTRQQGRVRTLNVIDVGYDSKEIEAAILKAVYDNRFRSRVRKVRNPYGDGNAASQIVDVLKRTDLKNPDFSPKRMTY